MLKVKKTFEDEETLTFDFDKYVGGKIIVTGVAITALAYLFTYKTYFDGFNACGEITLDHGHEVKK